MSVRARREAETEEFLRAVSPRLFRTALLLCGDHHLAEDLVQTALGKIYVSWGKVSRAEHPQAYARAILTRAYLSHVRLHRTRERPVAHLPERAARSEEPTLRLALAQALAQLTPKERAVVVLRYWEDRSVEETAKELRISQGNVRVRALRALAKLRTALESEREALGER
ncbi:SigE family RNA polymerase sigma factor [Streptomyces sp. SID11385]|uniref:SigE family RNA polymerase sigma factor n=1 Tax=Streptomyces sp. SID11385 TaxID=2706031 RepID=UPI0013CC4323|nr:SigE family RNA polymerase sigma factor [Streptomyces sp. SID11385]NEA43592.1 SigE family RNA polymerase sigma factor [Streptomyces sp. SID11385]